MLLLLLLSILLLTLTHSTALITINVRSDGTGNFTSIQSALDSLSVVEKTGLVVLNLLGYFHERVHIYSNFTGGVTLLNDHGQIPTDALITYGVAGSSVGTFSSYTLLAEANNVTMSNIAVANDAFDYNKTLAGQSVALDIRGDFFIADNSVFWGAQDTIYTGSGRALFRNSFINGSCDSVFGEGSAVFEECALPIIDTVTAHRGEQVTPWESKKSSTSATGSTPPSIAGYLFLRSILRPLGEAHTFLGRPWGPYSTTVLIDCELGKGIEPLGWEDWNHGCSNATAPQNRNSTWCANVTYAEFNSTGPGASPSTRVWWSQQLTATQAAEWTLTRVFGQWTPPPPVAQKYKWRAIDFFARH